MSRPKRNGDLTRYILLLEQYCDELEEDLRYYKNVKENIIIDDKSKTKRKSV